MRKITLVTGNPGKLREYQALLPEKADIVFEIQSLDLTEIQSLDSREIVIDKLQRAFNIVGSPVIVEDVSTGLDSLDGLPGPFFKFFEQKFGARALPMLTKNSVELVTVTCVTGYYDGTEMLFGVGVLHGKVVKPRGDKGFGFDPVIVPDGETRTMAEMTIKEKNAISHRGLAINALLAQM